jgi:hypothetical protein
MASRVRIRRPTKKLTIPLATGAAFFAGEDVGVVPSTHTCAAASTVTGMVSIGIAIEDVDQTAGDVNAQVELVNRVELEYFDNDTGPNAVVLSTDFLQPVYFKDSHTVTTAANNGAGLTYALAGWVYDVDTLDGVGISRVSPELASLVG